MSANIKDVWALHELTRQGKNPCPKCGSPMEMYYNPWCPKCDKPQIETMSSLNFIQVLHYLQRNGHPGIRNRMWEFFRDDISNDSYFTMCFPDEEEKEEYDEQVWEDLMLIKSEFNLGEHVLMHVSW